MPRGLQLDFTQPEVQDGNNPVASFDIESAHSVRVFDVTWLAYGIASYQILGYPQMDNTDPENPKIVRYLPQQDPDFPWMVATKITSVKGLGARGYYTAYGIRTPQYDKARLTVEFNMPDYDVLADEYTPGWPFEFYRYRTFAAKPSAEYLSPPSTGTLQWSQGPNALQAFSGNVGFIVGCIDYEWDWIQIPFEAMPSDIIQSAIGKVNRYDFPIGDGSDTMAAPGTLLLLAWEPLRKNSPYGLRTWRSHFTARYKATGHNNFYDYDGAHFGKPSHNPGWRQASVDGTYYNPNIDPDPDQPWPPTGKLLYDSIDYDLLFTPPALI